MICYQPRRRRNITSTSAATAITISGGINTCTAHQPPAPDGCPGARRISPGGVWCRPLPAVRQSIGKWLLTGNSRPLQSPVASTVYGACCGTTRLGNSRGLSQIISPTRHVQRVHSATPSRAHCTWRAMPCPRTSASMPPPCDHASRSTIQSSAATKKTNAQTPPAIHFMERVPLVVWCVFFMFLYRTKKRSLRCVAGLAAV